MKKKKYSKTDGEKGYMTNARSEHLLPTVRMYDTD